MNAEYVCELVRAHYEGRDERFDVIVRQLAASEEMHGSQAVADRLLDLQRQAREHG